MQAAHGASSSPHPALLQARRPMWPSPSLSGASQSPLDGATSPLSPFLLLPAVASVVRLSRRARLMFDRTLIQKNFWKLSTPRMCPLLVVLRHD